MDGGRQLAVLLSALNMHYLPPILLTAHHVHAWEKEDPDFEAAPRLGMFGLAPEAIAGQTATSYCDWHLIPDTNQMEAGRHARPRAARRHRRSLPSASQSRTAAGSSGTKRVSKPGSSAPAPSAS